MEAVSKGVRYTLRNRNLAVTALLLGIGVALLMTWNVVERYRDAGRVAGLLLKAEHGGLTVSRVVPGFPADEAGLQLGDSIVQISDTPVESLEDYDSEARQFRMGHPVVLTLLREGAEFRVEMRPGIEFKWFPTFLVSLTVLAYFLLGIVALLQGAGDIRALLLFGFSLSVAIEMSMPEFNYGPAGARTLAGVVFFLVSGIEMVLELHLAAVIPRPQAWLARHRWLLRLLYIVGLGFGILAAFVFWSEAAGFLNMPITTDFLNSGMNYVLFPIWVLGLVFLLGSQAIRYPTPQGRHQAGLVLIGVLPWAVYALAGTIYPGFYDAISSYNDVALSLILLAYPVAVFLAIFRFQLFDLERVVRRGLVYFSMSFILVAAFLLIFNLGTLFFSGVGLERGRIWLTSGAMLVLGMLFSPIHSMVQKLVERRFFPERSVLRQELIELAGDLPSHGNLPAMGRVLVYQLRKIFVVESVTLLIKRAGSTLFSPLASTLGEEEASRGSHIQSIPEDSLGLRVLRSAGRPVPLRQVRKKDQDFDGMLEQMGVSLLLPLMQKEDLIGLFLLGEREGGGRFPAEELELLNLLSHNVATSFENARLFESATYDSLTGLLRREPVIARLKQEILRAGRYGRPLSLAMADLDRFKDINDTYGHLSGDALLRRVAQVMRDGLRGTDVVGRYGGEEFLFIFPETTLEEAAIVAEKVRLQVSNLRLRDSGGRYFKRTVSIGLASIELSEDGETPSELDLIQQADEALYRAKSSGRNCVCSLG